jgi:hypothetical protein
MPNDGKRYLFFPPEEKGFVSWCDNCTKLQRWRLRHVRKFNGYTKDCRKEYQEMLKKRFGGVQISATISRTTIYANRHAPKGYVWCGAGLHYAPEDEMRKRGASSCTYCASKINTSSWRQWEQSGARIKQQRETIAHYNNKIKASRKEAIRLEKYLEVLYKKKREEEVRAGIY